MVCSFQIVSVHFPEINAKTKLSFCANAQLKQSNTIRKDFIIFENRLKVVQNFVPHIIFLARNKIYKNT